MRVMFTTFAAKSHVHTQVPLAWALRSAGHDVCVASQPDLAEYIEQTGLVAVPVGEPLNLDEQMAGVNQPADQPANQQPAAEADRINLATLDVVALADLTGLDPEHMTYEYLHTAFSVLTMCVYRTLSAEPMMDGLVEFARQWRPDLVIWDTMTFAGPVAAMTSGAAHARLLFGLDLFAPTRRAYVEMLGRRPPQLRDDPFEEWLGAALERHGHQFSEQAVTGQWTIDPVPPALRLPTHHHHVPVRYIPYNGPATIPDWLREPPKRRRVCLTLGVSHREALGGDRMSITELLQAIADLDIEVVATLNTDQLKTLHHIPDNVHTVDFVPLDALLPTCTAIISHGGSGSFQTALWHGIPQIIIPDMLWDTALKAQQLTTYGAGLHITDVDHFTANQLRHMLTRILDDPTFTTNANRLRQDMLATPTPSDIVPTLERLTAQHHAHR